MSGLYEVELEPEVRLWLVGLDDRDFGRVDFMVGLLAEQPELLGEPYSRHLGGKVRELRFRLLRQLQKECEARHGVAHEAFEREERRDG